MYFCVHEKENISVLKFVATTNNNNKMCVHVLSVDNGKVTVYLFRTLDAHLIRFLCSLFFSMRVKVDICLSASDRIESSRVKSI